MSKKEESSDIGQTGGEVDTPVKESVLPDDILPGFIHQALIAVKSDGTVEAKDSISNEILKLNRTEESLPTKEQVKVTIDVITPNEKDLKLDLKIDQTPVNDNLQVLTYQNQENSYSGLDNKCIYPGSDSQALLIINYNGANPPSIFANGVESTSFENVMHIQSTSTPFLGENITLKDNIRLKGNHVPIPLNSIHPETLTVLSGILATEKGLEVTLGTTKLSRSKLEESIKNEEEMLRKFLRYQEHCSQLSQTSNISDKDGGDIFELRADKGHENKTEYSLLDNEIPGYTEVISMAEKEKMTISVEDKLKIISDKTEADEVRQNAEKYKDKVISEQDSEFKDDINTQTFRNKNTPILHVAEKQVEMIDGNNSKTEISSTEEASSEVILFTINNENKTEELIPEDTEMKDVYVKPTPEKVQTTIERKCDADIEVGIKTLSKVRFEKIIESNKIQNENRYTIDINGEKTVLIENDVNKYEVERKMETVMSLKISDLNSDDTVMKDVKVEILSKSDSSFRSETNEKFSTECKVKYPVFEPDSIFELKYDTDIFHQQTGEETKTENIRPEEGGAEEWKTDCRFIESESSNILDDKRNEIIRESIEIQGSEDMEEEVSIFEKREGIALNTELALDGEVYVEKHDVIEVNIGSVSTQYVNNCIDSAIANNTTAEGDKIDGTNRLIERKSINDIIKSMEVTDDLQEKSVSTFNELNKTIEYNEEFKQVEKINLYNDEHSGTNFSTEEIMVDTEGITQNFMLEEKEEDDDDDDTSEVDEEKINMLVRQVTSLFQTLNKTTEDVNDKNKYDIFTQSIDIDSEARNETLSSISTASEQKGVIEEVSIDLVKEFDHEKSFTEDDIWCTVLNAAKIPNETNVPKDLLYVSDDMRYECVDIVDKIQHEIQNIKEKNKTDIENKSQSVESYKFNEKEAKENDLNENYFYKIFRNTKEDSSESVVQNMGDERYVFDKTNKRFIFGTEPEETRMNVTISSEEIEKEEQKAVTNVTLRQISATQIEIKQDAKKTDELYRTEEEGIITEIVDNCSENSTTIVITEKEHLSETVVKYEKENEKIVGCIETCKYFQKSSCENSDATKNDYAPLKFVSENIEQKITLEVHTTEIENGGAEERDRELNESDYGQKFELIENEMTGGSGVKCVTKILDISRDTETETVPEESIPANKLSNIEEPKILRSVTTEKFDTDRKTISTSEELRSMKGVGTVQSSTIDNEAVGGTVNIEELHTLKGIKILESKFVKTTIEEKFDFNINSEEKKTKLMESEIDKSTTEREESNFIEDRQESLFQRSIEVTNIDCYEEPETESKETKKSKFKFLESAESEAESFFNLENVNDVKAERKSGICLEDVVAVSRFSELIPDEVALPEGESIISDQGSAKEVEIKKTFILPKSSIIEHEARLLISQILQRAENEVDTKSEVLESIGPAVTSLHYELEVEERKSEILNATEISKNTDTVTEHRTEILKVKEITNDRKFEHHIFEFEIYKDKMEIENMVERENEHEHASEYTKATEILNKTDIKEDDSLKYKFGEIQNKDKREVFERAVNEETTEEQLKYDILKTEDFKTNEDNKLLEQSCEMKLSDTKFSETIESSKIIKLSESENSENSKLLMENEQFEMEWKISSLDTKISNLEHAGVSADGLWSKDEFSLDLHNNFELSSGGNFALSDEINGQSVGDLNENIVREVLYDVIYSYEKLSTEEESTDSEIIDILRDDKIENFEQPKNYATRVIQTNLHFGTNDECNNENYNRYDHIGEIETHKQIKSDVIHSSNEIIQNRLTENMYITNDADSCNSTVIFSPLNRKQQREKGEKLKVLSIEEEQICRASDELHSPEDYDIKWNEKSPFLEKETEKIEDKSEVAQLNSLNDSSFRQNTEANGESEKQETPNYTSIETGRVQTDTTFGVDIPQSQVIATMFPPEKYIDQSVDEHFEMEHISTLSPTPESLELLQSSHVIITLNETSENTLERLDEKERQQNSMSREVVRQAARSDLTTSSESQPSVVVTISNASLAGVCTENLEGTIPSLKSVQERNEPELLVIQSKELNVRSSVFGKMEDDVYILNMDTQLIQNQNKNALLMSNDVIIEMEETTLNVKQINDTNMEATQTEATFAPHMTRDEVIAKLFPEYEEIKPKPTSTAAASSMSSAMVTPLTGSSFVSTASLSSKRKGIKYFLSKMRLRKK